MSCCQKELSDVPPFAALRVPGTGWVSLYGPFQPTPTPVPGGYTLCVMDFDRDKQPQLLIPKTVTRAAPNFTQQAAPPLSLERNHTPSSFYPEQFHELYQLIKQGEITKAVPISHESYRCHDPVALALHLSHRLSSAPDSVHPYAYYNGSHGMWGISPETLFSYSPITGILKTEAVAGTVRDSAAQQLLSDPKNRHEHQIVVDELCSLLCPFGPVTVSPTEVRIYGDLAHLRAAISVNAGPKLDWLQVALALHPTAALSIAPLSRRTPALLSLLDPSGERGWFGAPFGLVSPTGDIYLLVAIRSVILRGSSVSLYAGSGIVEASTLKGELQEHAIKRAAVRAFFQI